MPALTSQHGRNNNIVLTLKAAQDWAVNLLVSYLELGIRSEMARFAGDTTANVLCGEVYNGLGSAPGGPLQISGMGGKLADALQRKCKVMQEMKSQ